MSNVEFCPCMNSCPDGCPCPSWGCNGDGGGSTSSSSAISTTPIASTSIETSTVITKPHTTPAGEHADAYLLIFNPLLDLDNSPSMSQLKFSWLLGEFCCEEKVDQVILNTPTAFDTERVRVHLIENFWFRISVR